MIYYDCKTNKGDVDMAKSSNAVRRNTFKVSKTHVDTVDAMKPVYISRAEFIENMFESILEGEYDDLLEEKPEYNNRLTVSKSLSTKVNEKLRPRGYDATKAIRLILDQMEIK